MTLFVGFTLTTGGRAQGCSDNNQAFQMSMKYFPNVVKISLIELFKATTLLLLVWPIYHEYLCLMIDLLIVQCSQILCVLLRLCQVFDEQKTIHTTFFLVFKSFYIEIIFLSLFVSFPIYPSQEKRKKENRITMNFNKSKTPV